MANKDRVGHNAKTPKSRSAADKRRAKREQRQAAHVSSKRKRRAKASTH